MFVDPGFGKNSFGTWGESHWSTIINHGLCSISGYIKSKGYNDIHLLDIRREKSWKSVSSKVEEIAPNVVGITVRSCDVDMVERITQIIKEKNRQTFIVIGGPHVVVPGAAEDMLKRFPIDCAVLGEGEISFFNILEFLRRGVIPERIIRSQLIEDLSALPFEDRYLYDYDKTVGLVNYPGIFKAPMITMIVIRGCLFNCGFCAPHSRNMFGKGVRHFSPKRTIEELCYWYEKIRFNSVKFYNSDFLADPNWVESFCDLYKKEGFTQGIMIQARASSLVKYPHLLKRLKDINLQLILFGFESGSDRILKFMQKGSTRKINLKAGRICREVGLTFGGSYMLGIPNETREDVDQTVSLAIEINADFNSVAFFTPLPGTYLYDYCERHNLSLIKSPEDLLNFSPEEPKIKGADYEYARYGASRIMSIKFGRSIILGKMFRLLYVHTKKYLWLRQRMVLIYSFFIKHIGPKLFFLIRR
jgi:anaerobic magnesium-protoporphyrin IX monomethyl ester cyclase